MPQFLAAIFAFLCSIFPAWQTGIASRFDRPEVDSSNRGGHACRYRSRRVDQSEESRQLERAGFVVALWGPPCWSTGTACLPRTGRCQRFTVADRGPMNVAIDLWTTLSRRLGHNGLESLVWRMDP